MLWHIKLVRISPGLGICRFHYIWWKWVKDFCWLCSMTAGCNFYNQLLFTACCLITEGWIKANRVSSLPILFCPLTVYTALPHPEIKRIFYKLFQKVYKREGNQFINVLVLYSFFLLISGRCYYEQTSHPRIAHGQRYPMPCLEWSAEEVE